MKNFPLFVCLIVGICACKEGRDNSGKFEKKVSASQILGNPEYLAISYGGYRKNSRDIQPTIAELKEDLRILSAMGIKLIRTYNVHLPHAANVLHAISEIKKTDEFFEMYVMLGAWIDCKNAWSSLPPDHSQESDRNEAEVSEVIRLAKYYPDIVKIIAVGNESMVHWAEAYYVEPWVILKYVNKIQELKKSGELPSDIWVTSSDNFASWGGAGSEYQNEDLNELIRSVDFLSVHTYPMHDTHYNPIFWGLKEEVGLSKDQKIELIMNKALNYAKGQYQSVKKYLRRLNVDKPSPYWGDRLG